MAGTPLNDRKLGATVRNKALDDIYKVLTDDPEVEKWSEYKKQILSKMSSSILPRMNEHTGEGGEPIQLDISSQLSKVYGRPDNMPPHSEEGGKS